MKFISYISEYLANITDIKSEYFELFLESLLIYLVVKIIKHLTILIFTKLVQNNKRRFDFKRKINTIAVLFTIICLIFVWESRIWKFMTLISFIAGAITFALRDIVSNFFSGIYIRVKKPFDIEDRIEIGDTTGDVIKLNILSFEVLQVNSEDGKGQSTGKIVHIPCSKIFSDHLVNQEKVFKYIWNEISVNVDLDSDIKKTKGILYKIVNKQGVIKRIPDKMSNQLTANNNGEYRIYYNKIEPIIYTKLNDGYVTLTIRYLIHPKKNRNIESDIWDEIIDAYKKGDIQLIKN